MRQVVVHVQLRPRHADPPAPKLNLRKLTLSRPLQPLQLFPRNRQPPPVLNRSTIRSARPPRYSADATRGSPSNSFAASSAASISASVVRSLGCLSIHRLPKLVQLNRVRCRRIQNPAYVTSLRIRRPHRIPPCRLRNLPIGKQVDNYRNLRHKTMHMTGQVIGGKCGKPNTIKHLRARNLTLTPATSPAKQNRTPHSRPFLLCARACASRTQNLVKPPHLCKTRPQS